MHKSKDITKYNIDWQIVRVQLKGEKDIDQKLAMAFDFFMDMKTIDNKERVIRNEKWLLKGYVQPEINEFMDLLAVSLTSKVSEYTKTLGLQIEELHAMREAAKTMKNTHKFFF